MLSCCIPGSLYIYRLWWLQRRQYVLEVEQEQEDGLVKVSLAMVAEWPIVVED